MAITSPRTATNFSVGIAPQTAEGSAASYANARFLLCRSAQVMPGRTMIDPQGSSGTRFLKDTLREVSRNPRVDLDLWGSVEALSVLLEAAMLGQPTVANADLTESNDGGAAVSAWSFTGVRPGFNTAWASYGACKLYVTVTDETPGAGQATVSVYSDSGRTAKVAEGSGANGATIALAAQNSSGLTGAVTLGTVSATDSDIELNVDTITYALAAQPARFWTVFVDDGVKRETVTDCVVSSLELSSQDRDALGMRVSIVGKAWSIGAGGGTGTPDHVTVPAHSDVTLRTDIDGTPVTESPTAVSFALLNDIEQALAGSAEPTKLILRGVSFAFGSTHKSSTEAQTLIDYDHAGTWMSADCKWTRSAKIFKIVLDRLRVSGTMQPAFSGRDVGEVALTWDVRQVVGSDTDPIVVTLQP